MAQFVKNIFYTSMMIGVQSPNQWWTEGTHSRNVSSGQQKDRMCMHIHTNYKFKTPEELKFQKIKYIKMANWMGF